MQGKQMKTKDGFYWKVPTRTSAGWEWAKPFLELYSAATTFDSRRKFMGCIFSADSYHHFTPRAVYLITHAALYKYDPGNTRTVISWRKYLITLALTAGITEMEQAAARDGPEHAEGKKSMSSKFKGKLSKGPEDVQV